MYWPATGSESGCSQAPALVTVRGGKRAQSPPCEPLAQHGFYGKEAETVDAIAAWMLGKPFPKDI